MWYWVAFVILLLFSGACGKQKVKPEIKVKKNQIVEASQTVKFGSKNVNMIYNPSVEDAKIFDSGLYVQGKCSIEKPAGWTTKNQVLNDSAGWALYEAHTGRRSLKIENIGGTDAYWEGKPIIFKQNANAFNASVWVKTKEIANKTEKSKINMVFDIDLEGCNNKVIKKYVVVDIPQKNYNWQKFQSRFFFADKITKIVPYLYFSGLTGTVWFDDMSIHIPKTDENTLYDSKKNGFGDLTSSEKGVFTVHGKKVLLTKDFIKVNKGKLYSLSGIFRSAGQKKSYIYLGLAFFSENKERITTLSVNAVKNTETEIIKDSGSNILYLKNAEKWLVSDKAAIAYDVDCTGQLKDIPNFKTSYCGISKKEKEGEYWKITLSKPIIKVSAGTKVREHMKDAENIYIYYGTVPTAASKFSGVFSLDDTIYGTAKYVKIILLANQEDNQSLVFEDILFKEIEMADD